uniref:Uncharacterized protein n=1 Tax=Populus alba TaxID=43335 RepID=A0A4U5QZ46_POPAL|nr:hypothetical protein D5086_0000021980 [Populus alba]
MMKVGGGAEAEISRRRPVCGSSVTSLSSTVEGLRENRERRWTMERDLRVWIWLRGDGWLVCGNGRKVLVGGKGGLSGWFLGFFFGKEGERLKAEDGDDLEMGEKKIQRGQSAALSC